MRKVLCAAFVACMFAVLSVLSVPTVQAKRVANAEGSFTWETITPETVLPAGGNTILKGWSEISVVGTLAGSATDVWIETDHAGHVTFNDILTISDCQVGDKSGALTLKLVGSCLLPDYEYSGYWMILYGTDGLSNLHGLGTWGGNPLVSLTMSYEGSIQFV